MYQSSWILQRGTSPIDWCEGNYSISPVIAEFVNTISNILFFVFPPLSFALFKDYAQCVNRGVYLIWAQLLVVGITSAYFHATLSLLGQLLDELAILWLVLTAFSMWLPPRYFPQCLNNDRKNLQALMLVVCLVGTVLICLCPVINAFALMWFGAPFATILFLEMHRCRMPRVLNLGYRSVALWVLAVICWMSDKFYCDVLSAINFPYLHGAWHILIALSSYSVCVLFAYFDALNEAPKQLPELRFWPSDKCELGVPYIVLKNPILKKYERFRIME